MSPAELARDLKAEASRLGFDMVGVAPGVAPPGYPSYLEWVASGRAGGMDYLSRNAGPRAHPENLLPGVRSVVVAGFVYGKPSEPPADPRRGRVARYAQGADYHEVLWRRLDALMGWLSTAAPGSVGRSVADTAPLLERDFARLAGLGWQAKNTMLISPSKGSYTVLGALLTDADIAADAPFTADRCGTCTRCLDACPTDAFDGPGVLDARRCISYLTIEHRGDLPDPESLHGWAFGCDVCQEVCPWNRKAPTATDPAFAPREEWVDPDLIAWLDAEPSTLAKSLKGTALKHAKRSNLVRNAALVLGTRGVVEAIPALRGRLDDDDPAIRAAAAWALDRLGFPGSANERI